MKPKLGLCLKQAQYSRWDFSALERNAKYILIFRAEGGEMFACLFNCQLICLMGDKQGRRCVREDTCVQEYGTMCSCKSFNLGFPCVGTAEESLGHRVDLLPRTGPAPRQTLTFRGLCLWSVYLKHHPGSREKWTKQKVYFLVNPHTLISKTNLCLNTEQEVDGLFQIHVSAEEHNFSLPKDAVGSVVLHLSGKSLYQKVFGLL